MTGRGRIEMRVHFERRRRIVGVPKAVKSNLDGPRDCISGAYASCDSEPSYVTGISVGGCLAEAAPTPAATPKPTSSGISRRGCFMTGTLLPGAITNDMPADRVMTKCNQNSMRIQPAVARRNKLDVICCTRGSGPCGRLQWDQGMMWPGGVDRPCDQKIVAALKTKLPFGPGKIVAV